MAASLSIPCQTPLPTQQGHWRFDCSSCLEAINDEVMLVIHDDKICVPCFDSGMKPQFAAALANESQYPVVCGGRELKLKRYRRCFTKSFRDAWKAKLREYHVHPKERLYCQGEVKCSLGSENQEICGMFLTTKTKEKRVGTCTACAWKSCTRCASSFIADGPTHICSAATAEAEDNALSDLTRGVEYQKCPSCDVAVELRDGCNHMTCQLGRCRTHFCFLCGERATRESGHWTAGKPCPLYHRKDATNAQYDGAMRGLGPEEVAALGQLRHEAEDDLRIGFNEENHVSHQVQLRRTHRAILDAILGLLEEEINQWPDDGLSQDERDEQLLPLRVMFRYVDILFKGVFAYTIDLEPDEARRDTLWRVHDYLGPLIVGLRLAAPEELRARFPIADEVFHRIVADAMRRIPADPEAAAAAA